jgi:hypothetical protein
MKLNEIRERLDALAEMQPGERIEDYSQRVFDGLPRMPYKELPRSLQQNVRERFTADILRDFLREGYNMTDFAANVLKMDAAHVADLPLPFEEEITAGIPAEDLDRILIRTRNTAVYTVEYEAPGQLAPMLYGNHAIEAFETAIDEYRERLQEKKQQEQAREKGQKPQLEQRAGKLVSAGFYQYVISDKKYRRALTTQVNKNAYIALMNPDFFKRLDFENGTVMFDQETAGIVKKYSKGKYTDVQDLDFPLLTQIYTAAVKSNVRHDAFTITVSLPQFFREMGIETSKGNAPDVMAKLHSFENCVGIMPGTQTVSKLFSIIQLDMKNQTMTFAVPYIMKLSEVLAEKNHVEKKTRQGALIDYQQPYHNTLVHSSIAKERNKTAVELVYLITTGLLQRAYVKDIKTYRKKGANTQYPERVTYSISFRSLINDAPLLRGRIQSYNDVKDKNRALRRAFEKAYELIDKKTDAAEWFIDLQGNRIIPTMTTLDDELIFTHNGRNGDYKKKK